MTITPASLQPIDVSSNLCNNNPEAALALPAEVAMGGTQLMGSSS